MYDLDGIIRFNKATSNASVVSIRPDVWLLPFLNVYGIFSKASLATDVGYGLWIPDSTNTSEEIISARSTAKFDATSAGFGITPTIGVGHGWFALDMNFTWTDISSLEKPAYTFVFGPRLGKTFKFKTPERNINFWVGGFRVAINSGTKGSINLADLSIDGNLQTKIDNGIIKVGDAQVKVDTWWDGLSAAEKANPVNFAKYTSANIALDKAGNILNAAAAAVDNAGNATVQYSLDKRPDDKWNFIVGSQFQLNKSLMVRAEYGFLGTREQFLFGLQYRFGL